MWTSVRFHVSTLTWRKAKPSIKSMSTCVRSFAAFSSVVRTSGADGGMFVGGRFASAGCDAVGCTVAAGCSAAGGNIGGLGDRMRRLAGGRVRMMPFRGWDAAASSGR